MKAIRVIKFNTDKLQKSHSTLLQDIIYRTFFDQLFRKILHLGGNVTQLSSGPVPNAQVRAGSYLPAGAAGSSVRWLSSPRPRITA